MVENVETESTALPEGVIDLSGNGYVTKKILKEGEGTEQPQGVYEFFIEDLWIYDHCPFPLPFVNGSQLASRLEREKPKLTAVVNLSNNNIFFITFVDGCQVSMHYTGRLTDGTKFDSSLDRNQPFEFKLNSGAVIKAFDMGVASMKKGEKCELICHPDFAYGKSGSPPNIPPEATLIFELELLDWKGEDLSPKKNDGIVRFTIVKGEKRGSPKEGSLVKIKLKGMYEGRVFEEREADFNIGEGSEANVIGGIEIALEKFKEGEKSRLIIAPEYAFGSAGNESFGIPGGATVEYEVELLTFIKTKQAWEMDPDEKIAQAKLLKEEGNKYMKDGKYNLALKKYERIQGYVSGFDDQHEESVQLKKSTFLNMSLVYQKIENTDEVIANCNKVLEIEDNNVKALYRRGNARLSTQDFDRALNDFNKILQTEPENKAAQNGIIIANHKIQEYKHREKKLFAGMFDKFAAKDQQKEDKEKKNQPDVMNSKFGEWNAEEREREPTNFEKENPDVMLLNGSSTEFKDM